MKYCSECGSEVTSSRRPRDKGPRYVCGHCRSVFYLSPRLVVACIAAAGDRILLCRRAVTPGYGLWSLPSGFTERDGTTARGAVRETLEEAQAAIELDRPYALFHIPRVNQVQVVYLARLIDSRCKAGTESLEARLFNEAEIPWAELAFTTTRHALRQYFQDFRSGAFGFHFADIVSFMDGTE